MKANELRIGNYYQWKDIASMGVGVGQITHGQQIEDYIDLKEGIPITSEWLEKFGFEKEDKITWSFGYEKHYDVYRKNELTYNGIQATWWYHRVLEHQPEYVHQLQNLYFCLCGEELTIVYLKQNQQQSQSE